MIRRDNADFEQQRDSNQQQTAPMEAGAQRNMQQCTASDPVSACVLLSPDYSHAAVQNPGCLFRL